MLKKIIAVIFFFLFLGGVAFFLWQTLVPRRVIIEIKSFPAASVFINGKLVGKTPYLEKNAKPGETKIKLVPDGLPGIEWQKDINLSSQTRLSIDRQFFSDDTKNEGVVLYLEKENDVDKSGFMITSVPEGGSVTVDDQMKGKTPFSLKDVGAGEHRIAVSYPSYKEKEVVAKAVNGYRLVVEILLAKSDSQTTDSSLSKPGSGSSAKKAEEMVVVKETPNGWLRVRDKSSTSGKELARVKTGDKFKILDEKDGWFKIEYKKNEKGWISGKYADKEQKDL